MQTTTPTVPNHHGDHPGFSGIGGLLAGLTMIVGRGEVARLAVQLTGVSPEDRVVDVGCGPGVAARGAARLGSAVTGVDPAAPMLALARRLTRRSLPLAWIEGTAEHLPLTDDSATVLWSISTVHHWHDIETGLAEAGRVLVQGGRLLAIELGRVRELDRASVIGPRATGSTGSRTGQWSLGRAWHRRGRAACDAPNRRCVGRRLRWGSWPCPRGCCRRRRRGSHRRR
jgi:SAM-dependent methyltransferase